MNYDHTLIVNSQLALSPPIRLVVNCLSSGSQVSGNVPLASRLDSPSTSDTVTACVGLVKCKCCSGCEHILMLQLSYFMYVDLKFLLLQQRKNKCMIQLSIFAVIFYCLPSMQQ